VASTHSSAWTSPPTVLQVGLEQERHLAEVLVPLLHPVVELREEPLRTGPPLPEPPLGELVGERPVAADVAQSEQRGRGLEIVGRQLRDLVDRADAVSELEALVPHGVPEALADGPRVDVGTMEQHDVEVRLRGQLPPGQPAGSDECHPLVLHSLGEEGGRPAEQAVGQRRRQRHAPQGAVGQHVISAQRFGHGHASLGRPAPAPGGAPSRSRYWTAGVPASAAGTPCGPCQWAITPVGPSL
jgi:hypothetical protein